MHTLQSHLAKARNETERKIIELGPWFHNIRLPDGTQTAPQHPLGDFPLYKWQQVEPHIPKDLSGWRVLDVGCNAGFYSLELARRGAQVDALDIDERYLKQARWVLGQYGLEDRVRTFRGSVYQVARMQEEYDLIWFMGVLYHLRHPLLALDILAAKTRRMMVFQTLEMPGGREGEIFQDLPFDQRHQLNDEKWPRMAFIEEKFANDPTNWWVPNHVCTRAMLRSSGLQIDATPADEIYVCSPNPNPLARMKADLDLAESSGPEPFEAR